MAQSGGGPGPAASRVHDSIGETLRRQETEARRARMEEVRLEEDPDAITVAPPESEAARPIGVLTRWGSNMRTSWRPRMSVDVQEAARTAKTKVQEAAKKLSKK